MRYVKYILSIIMCYSSLYSQINIDLIKIINLADININNEFQSTNLCISPTGFYLLDSENRQIAYLSNEGAVIFAGGYGIENDAFIDPIEILSSQLRTMVIDRTENKLIEFDHKLNYLRTIEFDQIYPEFSGIDDWGNMLLLSEQENMIVSSNLPIENFSDFIDLSIWSDLNNCITDMYVALDGTIGILSNCNNSIHLFNRLGKMEYKYFIENADNRFVIKLLENWFVITTDGHMKSIRHNEKVKLPIELAILDIAQMDGNLYILFSDKIWVVDVSME